MELTITLNDLVSLVLFQSREKVAELILEAVGKEVDRLEVKIKKGTASGKDVDYLHKTLRNIIDLYLEDYLISAKKEERLLDMVSAGKVTKDNPPVKLSKADKEKVERIRKLTYNYIGKIIIRYKRVLVNNVIKTNNSNVVI